MKKVFLLILFCLIYKIGICQKPYGCTYTIEYNYNIFGDKTNEYLLITALGYYPYNANKANCNLYIKFNKKNVEFICDKTSLFRINIYNNNDNFIQCYNSNCIIKPSHKRILDLFNNNDSLKIIIKDPYNSTKGVFKLYNCKDIINKYNILYNISDSINYSSTNNEIIVNKINKYVSELLYRKQVDNSYFIYGVKTLNNTFKLTNIIITNEYLIYTINNATIEIPLIDLTEQDIYNMIYDFSIN